MTSVKLINYSSSTADWNNLIAYSAGTRLLSQLEKINISPR